MKAPQALRSISYYGSWLAKYSFACLYDCHFVVHSRRKYWDVLVLPCSPTGVGTGIRAFKTVIKQSPIRYYSAEVDNVAFLHIDYSVWCIAIIGHCMYILAVRILGIANSVFSISRQMWNIIGGIQLCWLANFNLGLLFLRNEMKHIFCRLCNTIHQTETVLWYSITLDMESITSTSTIFYN